MPQLTWSAIPGMTDLSDTLLAADKTVTDDVMLKLSHNAKAAAVRCEFIFMGFYKHGDTVGLPASPVDGYAYQRAEVIYLFSLYATRAPGAGFVSGQASPPGIAPDQPQPNIRHVVCDINDATGAVTIIVSYMKSGGEETTTNDGMVKVYAVCQRSSVNVAS